LNHTILPKKSVTAFSVAALGHYGIFHATWRADVCLQTTNSRADQAARSVFSEEVTVMGKGDNRQKNDKKNKKVKKDAKKPGIPASVKKV